MPKQNRKSRFTTIGARKLACHVVISSYFKSTKLRQENLRRYARPGHIGPYLGPNTLGLLKVHSTMADSEKEMEGEGSVLALKFTRC